MPAHRKPLETTFWISVAVGGDADCWPWMGSRLSAGYGKLERLGKAILAHRGAFFLANGYWPEVVRHACDNPPCCNPKHLIGGTPKDNVQDMDERGRRAKGFLKPRFTGEKNMQAKLTADAVRYIRMSNETLPVLAAKFKVSISAISQVRSGATWSGVK